MIWDQIWAALAAKWHAAIKNSALHDDFSGYFMKPPQMSDDPDTPFVHPQNPCLSRTM